MSESQKSDASAVPLIGLAFIMFFIFGGLYWKSNHTAVAYLMAKIAWFQAYPFMDLFGLDGVREKIVMTARHAGKASFAEAFSVLQLGGRFWAWLPIGMIGLLLYKTYTTRYETAVRKLNHETLLREQAKVFSAVYPVADLDLTENTSPEWRPADGPEDWANQYGLIKAGRFDAQAAKEILEANIGREIKTLNDLKPHERALFVVFAERIYGEIKDSAQIIDELNYSAPRCKMPDCETEAIKRAFQKHAANPDIQQLLKVHRYQTTFLMRLMAQAKDRGKMPSSHFIWLRPNDRQLWYALNTVGRKVPFMESAAAFAQLRAEMTAESAGHRLTQPYVSRAVLGWQDYLFKVGMVDEPGKGSISKYEV